MITDPTDPVPAPPGWAAGAVGALAAGRTALADVLARPGTRAVLLAGSRDPNAKVTLILLDDYGPAFVVKAPTTRRAAEVVVHEGRLLRALRDMPLGRLATSLPQPVGYLDSGGLPALVTNAIPGVPMTVRYHAWRHTARRRRVRADFAAAGAWLADLHGRTAGPAAPVTLLRDSLEAIATRFPDHPGLAEITGALAGAAARLARHTTPRTVLHGDYWYGNLLLDRRGVVAGVVDWESGETAGEPLRDVARFAVSYALYIDRHARPRGRVPGHRGLRADRWGAGLEHAVRGHGWFGRLVHDYTGAALERLGLPASLAADVLLAGVADVAATADHPGFGRQHLDVLARLVTGAGREPGALEPSPAPSPVRGRPAARPPADARPPEPVRVVWRPAGAGWAAGAGRTAGAVDRGEPG